MTNLLEKSLLVGFGVFLIISFFSLVSPFLTKVVEFDKNNDLDSYLLIISEIDRSILYIIENPEEDYNKKVEYPSDLNITLSENYVICKFLIENIIYSRILSYNETFLPSHFYDVPPQTYLLNVNYELSLIKVQFIKYY